MLTPVYLLIFSIEPAQCSQHSYCWPDKTQSWLMTSLMHQPREHMPHILKFLAKTNKHASDSGARIGSSNFENMTQLVWLGLIIHPDGAKLITEALISEISPISRSADHACGDNGGVGDTLWSGTCPHLNRVKDTAQPHQTPCHRPPRTGDIIPLSNHPGMLSKI